MLCEREYQLVACHGVTDSETRIRIVRSAEREIAIPDESPALGRPCMFGKALNKDADRDTSGSQRPIHAGPVDTSGTA